MITRTTLGSPGLTVSTIGLWCMGMSESYGAGDRARHIRGARDYVLRACDASLLRLGVEVIDLYHAHRPRTSRSRRPSGRWPSWSRRARHLGLSEVDGELLRRAHAVHPITAVQSEYSLWTRDVEAVTPRAGRAGSRAGAVLAAGAWFPDRHPGPLRAGREGLPAHQPPLRRRGGQANEKIAQTVREVADRLGANPAQVGLAWVHAQAERLGVAVATIPGTRSPDRLEQNAAALQLTLDAEALAALDPLSDQVTGERYLPAHAAEVARG